MSMSRKVNRCPHPEKDVYRHEPEAARAAAHAAAAKSKPLGYYRCACRWYHLTHSAGGSTRGIGASND